MSWRGHRQDHSKGPDEWLNRGGRVPALVTTTSRIWPDRVLLILLPVAGLLLVLEVPFRPLDERVRPVERFHVGDFLPSPQPPLRRGYALGVVVVVIALVSLFTGQRRAVLLAVVLAVSVGWAGVSGSLFIRSSPNNPMYSVSMGLAFLIAFWAALMLVTMAVKRRSQGNPASTAPSMASS